MAESENILLHRFAVSGDPEAFAEIVRRHAGLVYGACLRVLADKDRAADAVQETFLQLLRNAKTITGSVPLWLHRVATRKAIDVVRRESSRKSREAVYAADKPREVTKWQDLSRHVDEGLDDLDDDTRDILIQRFFQGKTTNEIAEAESISQPTVSRRIDAGVAQLRAMLRNRGVLVSAAVFVALLGENVVQAAPSTVMTELGKIALVGGEAAAATGAGAAAASATGAGTAASASGGAKVATGVLAGVKAKVITAAAVTAVGVGSVVTYNHVTEPSAPQSPSPVVATQQNPRSSQSSVAYTQPAPVQRQTAANRQVDWSQYEGDMWEQIFAEEDSKAPRVALTPSPPLPDQGDDKPVGGMMMGGGFGGGYGGMGMGSYPPEPGAEEDVNGPPMGYGGMGGMMYFGATAPPPSDDEDSAE